MMILNIYATNCPLKKGLPELLNTSMRPPYEKSKPIKLNGLIFYGPLGNFTSKKVGPPSDCEDFKIYVVLKQMVGPTPIEVKFTKGQ